MKARYIVTGVLGLDGEYDLELESLTARELEIVKRLSGVRANEFDEALVAGDAALHVATAMIAMRRNGKDAANLPGVEDALMDAPLSAFKVKLDPEDDEKDGDDTENPPATQPE